MKKIIAHIIKHRKIVLMVFLILAVVSGLLMTQVKVNYKLQDYLPEESPSTKALPVFEKAFDFTMPNARAVLPTSSLEEAIRIKEDLINTEGIEQVIWLDDYFDLKIPLEFQDKATVESFYKDGQALYQISANTNNAVLVSNNIYALNPDIKVDGQLIDLANAQNGVQTEVFNITIFIVPLVFIVLLLSTHAWLEPFIFAAAIGMGILLNMGSNIFLGQISFISQAIAAVLQLAVSMDYAVFLLNRFNANRQLGYDAETAMAMAMERAFIAVSSSAMTTIFGFLALIFMRFRIGADLGIVMAKGVVISFISVMIFMPALLLSVYQLVDKTTHKNLLPDFSFLGKFVLKGKLILVIIALIVVLPSFLGSRANDFIYGMGAYPKGSRIQKDKSAIEETFGQQQQMALLVPRGDTSKELTLLNKLEDRDPIISVMTYTNTVDQAIPKEVIDDPRLDMLVSDEYSSFMIIAGMKEEGEEAFGLVEYVRQAASEVYGDDYYLLGQAPSMLDMKTTIEKDDLIVNGLAILAIGIVLLFAFKSISLPIILVLIIEIAIWINLAIPYFIGINLSYIGYLIISTVQLGATVDYAILYTEHYLEHRKNLDKKTSLVTSLTETVPSLLPPALILSITGFILRYISSITIVSELGEVLGRGAILSFLMVVLVLPGILYYLDRIIEKTSMGLKFNRPGPSKIDKKLNLEGGQDE